MLSTAVLFVNALLPHPRRGSSTPTPSLPQAPEVSNGQVSKL